MHTRVAQRHIVRQAARQIVSEGRQIRTASAGQVRSELTVEVLEAFGSAIRTAANPMGRLKQLWEMFQEVPRAWAQFKQMIGIKADGALALAMELPSKIKQLIKEGEKALSHVGQKLRELPPIALYFDIVKNTPSANAFITKMVDYLPAPMQKVIHGIHSKAKSFTAFIDETVAKYPSIKPMSALISAAIFTVIWMNAYELSWDVPSILKGFLGGFSWTELLDSIPESAAGFALSLMFPGIPTGLILKAGLPLTLALRLAWLLHKGQIEYKPGHGVSVKHLPRSAPPLELAF
jgi:hypothetical protein